MNNNMMIFKNDNFGDIQIIEENGRFEFEATGVANILKYVNPYDAIRRHCKKDGVVKHEVIDNLGRTQQKNFISEGNLYRLITHSKLPDAEKFESWVFDEVLPSIRKNGKYETKTDTMMRQLTESQLLLNNVLSSFKVQIDDDFRQTNEKIEEHDKLLRKRVYLSPKEAKDVQVAVRNKAKQIALDYDLPYQTVKGKLFKRLYTALDETFEVGTYRELPSIQYENIIDTIKKLRIAVKDLQNDTYQMSL